jgi:TonB-linked SusC/RagA family outer membrane protein
MSSPVLRCLAALTLVALPGALAAQEATTVTGRITNEAGAPLAATAVSISALGLGSMTRDDGTYSFVVPANRVTGQTVTVLARRVGYTPASASIVLRGGTITQNFTLVQSPLRLQEVVVTGAGTTQLRERLGNVINSVDSGAIRRASEPQNVVAALAGKAPNVEIRTQSGEPGSSASIKIRGATSVLGTNQPLFVVDNQPIDNTTVSNEITTWPGSSGTVQQNRAADINPNDIESIEILKGSAAAAIYGARAANGVILITTTRGTAGPTRYTFSSTSTFDNVIKTMPLQRTFGQGSEGVAATCTAVNCAPTSLSWGAALPAGTPTYDHGKEIYRTGLTTDNNLSVSGGNNRTTFFISGGQTSQKGIIQGPHNRYERTSLRLKASHELINALTLGGNLSYVDARGSYVQKGSNTSGLLLGALRTPPEFDNRQYLDPVTGLHRSYRFPRPNAVSLRTGRGYDNPFFVLNNPGNRSELGRFIGNVSLDYVPAAWVSFRYTLGADSYGDSRVQALPLTSSDNPQGAVTRHTINNLEVDHNLTATLQHELRSDISTRLVLGQNLNMRRARQVWVNGQQLNAPEPLALQNTLTWNPVEVKSRAHIEAYFAQAEADLYNQLFLTLGIRNDGFSTFGANNRRANYPKASVAWTFTNALGNTEQRGPLSFGKLRVAYGETGREPPVYGTITALSSTTLLGSGYGDFIGVSQSGQGGLVTSSILGNENLKPERNRETEFGTDLGFFDQRADLSLTYYDKRSSDVILYGPVHAGSTGALTQLSNAATITNKGVEATLNLRPINRPNLSWNVGFQYGRNRGKVVALAEGVEFVTYNNEGFTGSIGSSTIGYQPGVIRGFDFVRCGQGKQVDIDGNNTLENIDALCGSGAPAGALFLGSDGWPVIDPDEQVMADPNPRWTGAVNSQLRFGRWQVSGLVDIRRGGQIWNGTRGALYRFGTHKDTEIRTQTGRFGVNWLTDVYPHVAGPGVASDGTVTPFATTPAEWQLWFTTYGGSASDAQAQFVEDGSFVKLREISLSYRLEHRALMQRFGVASADIRIAGRNLKTWTDYKGLDPETNLGGAEWLTQGVDFFNSPLTRSFVLSLTLNR